MPSYKSDEYPCKSSFSELHPELTAATKQDKETLALMSRYQQIELELDTIYLGLANIPWIERIVTLLTERREIRKRIKS